MTIVWIEKLDQEKSIGPALETRQYHTIEYGVSKIVSEGHYQGNKSPAVLRGSAARRLISIPMCNKSTTCFPNWHILSRSSTITRAHRVTPDLIQHTQYCHRSTMSNVTLKHTHSQKPSTNDCTVQQFKVGIGSRAPHCRTVLENGLDKIMKASPKKRSIVEHSPGLPQDTKSLRSCSGERAKMFLKGK